MIRVHCRGLEGFLNRGWILWSFMTELIITEKPQAALKIASALGRARKLNEHEQSIVNQNLKLSIIVFDRIYALLW